MLHLRCEDRSSQRCVLLDGSSANIHKEQPSYPLHEIVGYDSEAVVFRNDETLDQQLHQAQSPEDMGLLQRSQHVRSYCEPSQRAMTLAVRQESVFGC